MRGSPEPSATMTREAPVPPDAAWQRDPGGSLWAITSYFNPSGYRRRRANYRVFRDNLPLPLLAIEWSPSGQFELQPGDADLLIQVGGGDVLWQKERLLNLAVDRLPPSCRHVVWVDCDIVFEAADLGRGLLSALEDHALVQAFESVRYLDPLPLARMHGTDAWRSAGIERDLEGAVFAYRDRKRYWERDGGAEILRRRGGYRPAPGFAWAAHRDFLARHPLLDVWAVGGGDTAYTYAAIDAADYVVKRHKLSRPHRELFFERAARLHDELRDRVGLVPGRVMHLWHGDIDDRCYNTRHLILSEHRFDPARHLRLDHTGVWAWAQAPEALRSSVVRYFDQRREDGEADAA